MSEITNEPQFINSLAKLPTGKLPTGKLRPMSETELTPATGRVFVYRGEHLIGGRPWVIRIHEPERTEQ